jgi:hypothetical protein
LPRPGRPPPFGYSLTYSRDAFRIICTLSACLIPLALLGPHPLKSDKIENFLGNLGNDMELDMAEGGCTMIPLPGNIRCGADMELPAINSKRSLVFQLKPQCIASQEGPNPVGKCYMLLSFDLQLPLPNNWDADSLGFYTVSEQEDGNLWWSWNYGPVSRAAGLLTRD